MNFSVLMSIYYKEDPYNLSKSLDSIINQTCLPSEVILVMDGPLNDQLDKTIKLYQQRMPYLITVPLSENVGLGKALNVGLQSCSYPIIARMDTDDICKPDRFEKQLSVFKNNPDIDVVSSWIDEFEDDITNVLSTRKLPETHSEIYAYGKQRCPVNHPVVMFKKSAVLAAGGYMHLPLFEDYYLWVRMLVNGAKFYNIQDSLLYFRTSPAMFMRRGGLKYAMTEVSFLWKMHKIGYVNLIPTIKSIIIRFTVRIMPNSVRGYIYKKLLR